MNLQKYNNQISYDCWLNCQTNLNTYFVLIEFERYKHAIYYVEQGSSHKAKMESSASYFVKVSSHQNQVRSAMIVQESLSV